MSMQKWTLPLSSALSASLVGRKAAALGRLIEAGFPVPPGVCISTDAFLAACAQASEKVSDLRLPDGLLDELVQALPMDKPLAVRTSAEVEDLPEVSHAGRYITRLNVTGLQELEQAVLDCWQGYCAGLDDASGIAILIQPMLNAECSGVCFTVDPVRQEPDLLLVTVGWGLGAGVGEGSVPADVHRLRRVDLGTVDESIAEKSRAVRAAAAGGVEIVRVKEDRWRIPCLPPEWLQRVGQYGLTIEQVFGAPQDIEWAVADGQIWILQSRPVTALPDAVRKAVLFPLAWENEQVDPRKFWWNVTEGGSPLYPAALDYQSKIRGGQDAVYFGGSSDTRWVRRMNGRAFMARAKSENTPGHVRIYGAAIRDLYERLARQNVTMWEHWGPEIVLATERLAAFDPITAGGPALAEHIEDAAAASDRHWMIHTMVPRMIRSAALLDAYARLVNRPAEELGEDIPFLIAGEETIQTRLVEMLYDLACLSSEDVHSARKIALAYPHVPASQPFAQGFARLMAVYGDRTVPWKVHGYPAELPLPWREVPEYVWGMIAAYLPLAQSDGPGPREARLRALRRADARVDKLCAAASDPALVEDFRRKLAFASRNAAFLDEHNHYIDQVSHGQYYQALIHAGRFLAECGKIPHAFDVFWLHQDEVLAALRAEPGKNGDDLNPILAARCDAFAGWQAMIPPPCLGLPDPFLPERPKVQIPHAPLDSRPSDLVEAQRLLRGEPASRGRISGRARRITGTDGLAEAVPGDILIAPFAGSLLIPILPVTAGMVLDDGGPGDHFAITAREFGVPVVCATRLATQRIPDGAWVTVDADAGLITWE